MDERTKDLELASDRDPQWPEAGAADLDEVEILSIEGGEGTETPTAEPAAEQERGFAGDSETLRRELEELRDRSLRAMADFDNYRKRAEREREELRRQALAGALLELLPVVDNMERAVAAQGSIEDLRLGVEMTLRQLQDVLRRLGLSEVPAVGVRFDPHVHQAVMREERSEVVQPTVAAELLRGYLLHDRVLRPAMVTVAVPSEEDGQPQTAPPAAD